MLTTHGNVIQKLWFTYKKIIAGGTSSSVPNGWINCSSNLWPFFSISCLNQYFTQPFYIAHSFKQIRNDEIIHGGTFFCCIVMLHIGGVKRPHLFCGFLVDRVNARFGVGHLGLLFSSPRSFQTARFLHIRCAHATAHRSILWAPQHCLSTAPSQYLWAIHYR